MFWRRRKENWYEKTWGVKGPGEYEVLAWLLADPPRIEEALDVVVQRRQSLDEELGAGSLQRLDPYEFVGYALRDWFVSQPGVPKDQDRRQDLARWVIVGVLPGLDWTGLAKYLLDREPGLRQMLEQVRNRGVTVRVASDPGMGEDLLPLEEFGPGEPIFKPGYDAGEGR